MKSVRVPVHVPKESLTFPLRQAADRFPDKVAVVEPEVGGREWTYGTLEDQSSALAASLADLRVNPGDRVALWMKNSVEYILSFYGIMKAGGVVVPVSTHYGARELAHQLQVTGAVGIIATEERLSQAPDLRVGASGLRFIVSDSSVAPLSGGPIPFHSLLTGTKRLDRSGELSSKMRLRSFHFPADYRITAKESCSLISTSFTTSIRWCRRTR
jgi:long-chain acyl-CoA synthetase